MANIPFFIDFHCHPAMKPYGKSFGGGQTGGINSENALNENSIWFYDPPQGKDGLIQDLLGIAKFRQSDCCTLSKANCRLVFASLYPIERGFFRNDLGAGIVSRLANDFITGVGTARVTAIQNITDYFSDTKGEYDFYVALDNKVIDTDNGNCRYKLITSYQQMLDIIAAEPGNNNIIFMAMTIEGMHVLHNNIAAPPDETTILENLDTIKNWDFRPFFVTVAHHFYNHLCGHAQSLFDLVGAETNQLDGLHTGFTDIGLKVVDRLLRKQGNEKRILIDIKHMSIESRWKYFEILESDQYKNEQIPIIVSHGAANGLPFDPRLPKHDPDTGGAFMTNDINFYDEEIVKVAKSGGIFALQLDERRLINADALKKVKKRPLSPKKTREFRSAILWNQIRYIAGLLDANELPTGVSAWDCLAIGSDYDGIINPLNGFLTAESLGALHDNIEQHARNYVGGKEWQKLRPENRLAASEIADRIFYLNADAFLRKWFV